MSNSSSTKRRFRAEMPDELLSTQETAISFIVDRFIGISLRGLAQIQQGSLAARPQASSRAEVSGQGNGGTNGVLRPHQIFCIDGGRGAGKTYTLLFIQCALAALESYRRNSARIDTEEAAWIAFLKERLGASLQSLDSQQNVRSGLTKVLRVIFPGEMETRESPMETIFASITADLEDLIDQCRPEERERRQALTSLIDDLRKNVAQGWYFAKGFGTEAIIRDSISYDDFVRTFEQETRKSSRRIENWREFLDRYLSAMNIATITILLDDSDVQPELTHEILHSIRMFLNHPRVITILAGNIRAMRHSLLQQAMARLGPSTAAFAQVAVPPGESNPTAHEWRQTERRAVEDYLEKVLPVDHRFFLKTPLQEYGIGGPDESYEKITTKSLSEICDAMLKENRLGFLDTKFQMALRRSAGGLDRPEPEALQRLEAYLSWWMFVNRYQTLLAPRSARQIQTFGEFYVAAPSPRSSGGDRGWAKRKRLVLALFDSSENFSLIQRLTDEDINVSTWLLHQRLGSSWVGRRYFEINGRQVFRGSYTYDYLRFRLDLGLAMPVRENFGEIVPRNLLPALQGRQHLRRFFQPQRMPRRQRRIGIARWIDHAAIPGNCVYFSDLEALPDASLVENSQTHASDSHGAWEAGLAITGYDMLDDNQNEYLYRYFTEIVCPSQRGTASVSNGELLRLLDPPTISEQVQSTTYETSLDDEYRWLDAGVLDTPLWCLQGSAIGEGKPASWPKQLMVREGPDVSVVQTDRVVKNPKRGVALYAAMITDIRRTWHALRINEMSWGRSSDHSQGDVRESFASLASQERMELPTLDRVMDSFRRIGCESLFKVFAGQNVSEKIRTFLQQVPDVAQPKPHGGTTTARGFLDDVGDLYKVEVPTASIQQEYDSFLKWRDTLRKLGRIICEGWPVHGDSNNPEWPDDVDRSKYAEHFAELEGRLFENCPEHRLNVHAPTEEASETQISRRSNARTARNFIWLLYGVAPSLPAVIHMNIMGRLYQAELLARGVSSMGPLDESELTKIQGRVRDFYKTALAEVDTWADQIGQFAVTLRYIRVKYQHLHIGFALHAAWDRHTDPAKPVLRPEVKTILRNAGLPIQDDAAVAKLFGELCKLFIGPTGNIEDMATDLAIMPDVASSTLFWSKWLEDAVRRVYDQKSIDPTRVHAAEAGASPRWPTESETDPQVVRGVFSESEQWLWAINRQLSKLREKVSLWQNVKVVDYQTSQPPA